MKLEWSKLTPENFEKFCSILLEKNGLRNIQWHGAGGSDRGRDILCEKVVEPLPGITQVEKWLVQCKRYTEKRISKTDLNAILTSAREHQPDNVLLIVTDTLNSALKDWLKKAQADFNFNILVWEELQLQRESFKHRKDLLELFPELTKQDEPLLLYRRNHSGTIFGCNEFDEVEIHHTNEADYDRAKEIVREFIQFLRTNRVAFDENPDGADAKPGEAF